jgi:hypothetical protein
VLLLFVAGAVSFVQSSNIQSAFASALYYQLIQAAGSPLPQEPTLNFPSAMTCVDDPSHTRTNCTPSGGAGISWFAGTITAPVPASWGALGSGCATSTVTGVAAGNALQVVSSSGAQNLCGLQTAVAGGDFSHVFTTYNVVSSVTFGDALVGFTDGTKFEGCGVGTNNAASSANNLAGPLFTSGKGTALSGGSLAVPNGASSYNNPFGNFGGPDFFRLRRTGTNLACDVSPDGQNWFNLFNDTSPYLTASAVFVAADPRGATGLFTTLLESFQ